jgi:hypothetical protein
MRSAVVAACCIACSHPAAPVAPVVTNKVAAPLTVAPHRYEDALDYLPASAELVAGIDFQHLVHGALWQSLVEPEIAKNLKLAEFKSLCGFDPLETITTIALGASGVGGSSTDVELVIQGPERVAMSACIAKAAALDPTIVRDGDSFFGTAKDGSSIALGFVGDHTMVALKGLNATKDGLARRATKSDGLRTSATFAEVFRELDHKRTVWMIMDSRTQLFSKLSLGIAPRVIFGTLDADDGLELDVTMRLDDPATAAQLAAKITTNLASAKGFVDQLDVTTEQAETHLVAKLSAAKLAMLASLVTHRSAPTGGLGGATTP